MQGKTVQLQRQSKKQTGSPGKRQPNLCHQSSSAWGIEGAQGCCAGVQGGEGFLTTSRSRAGRCNHRHLAGMHGRQVAKEGSPGELGHADGDNILWETGERKAANEKETNWVRLCHFCSVSLWEGALYVLCPVCKLSHLGVNTDCPGKFGHEGGVP